MTYESNDQAALHLSRTAEIWSNKSIFEHGFLAYTNDSDLSTGRAYVNISPFFIGIHYLVLRPVTIAGLSYSAAENFLIFAYLFVLLALIYYLLPPLDLEKACDCCHDNTLNLLGAFLIVSISSLWIGIIRFHSAASCSLFVTICIALFSIQDWRGITSNKLSLPIFALVSFIGAEYMPLSVIIYYLFITYKPTATSKGLYNYLGYGLIAACGF